MKNVFSVSPNSILEFTYLSRRGNEQKITFPYRTADDKKRAADGISTRNRKIKTAFEKFLSQTRQQRPSIASELRGLRRKPITDTPKTLMPTIIERVAGLTFAEKNSTPASACNPHRRVEYLSTSQAFRQGVESDNGLLPSHPPWADYEYFPVHPDVLDDYAVSAHQENQRRLAHRAYSEQQPAINQNDGPSSDEEETPEEMQAFLDSINIFKN